MQLMQKRFIIYKSNQLPFAYYSNSSIIWVIHEKKTNIYIYEFLKTYMPTLKKNKKSCQH